MKHKAHNKNSLTSIPKFGASCRKQRGFTLFEILIVIFIIGLLTIILAVNMRGGEKRYQLQIAAQEIAQNIRRAQDMALTSFRYQEEIPINYGVFFDKQNPTSYIIFADVNGNNKWDAPDKAIDPDSTKLENGIEINSISGDPRLHITFSLPDGFTHIEPSASSATVTIKRSGTSCPSKDCKTIEILTTGQVNIK